MAVVRVLRVQATTRSPRVKACLAQVSPAPAAPGSAARALVRRARVRPVPVAPAPALLVPEVPGRIPA